MPIRPVAHLVGRDVELRRVLDALGRPEEGGAVLVGGDAGIGKTALVGRLVADAGERRVLVGHGVGDVWSLPYLPFVEMFGGLDARERGLVDELVAEHPGLVALVPRLVRGTGGTEVARADLVEAVHGALGALGSRSGVLVVVEDTHWADESTRELLTLLFTRGAADGVHLVATYRSDDVHRRHPLASTLEVWRRLPGLTRVELGPLADADLREVVRGAGRDLDETVVGSIVQRAEGNAFFAEELVAAASVGAPTDLGRLLLGRVDRLDEEAQAVVRVAAVVGRRVPHRLLERVADVEPGVLRRALRSALEHHVLEPWGDVGYEFRHALLAEAVSDDLLPTERVQLHRACAEALREDAGLGAAADLARHALASGDRSTALAASVRAGDTARRMGGPAEALAHYETALALLDADPAQARSVTLRAAAAANASGRALRAMALLRDRLAADTLSAHERAELLGALAFAARLTEERVDRLALTGEALGLVDDDAPVRLRVGLLARRAEALMDADAHEEALEVADAAMTMAVEHDLGTDRVDLTTILARLGEVAGDPVESIRRLQGVVSDWTAEPDLAVLRALHILASIHYRQGDLDTALAGYERTAAEARRAGLAASVYGVDTVAMAVTTAYEVGAWDHALALADASRADALPEGAVASVESAAGLVRAARGEVDPEALLARSRPWWSEDTRIAVQVGTVAVEALGRRGSVERMLEVHDDVVGFLRRAWERPRVAVEVRYAALVLAALTDRVRSAPRSERDSLLRTGERLGTEALTVWGPEPRSGGPTLEGRMWTARVQAELARLRWAAGTSTDEAALVARWREALGLAQEQGDIYEVTRVRTRLAEVLLAAGDPTAGTVLETARADARRLGAVHVLGELEAVRPPAPAEAVLTAREQEVMGLLARGRSNGEIGRALFISTKTASVHVSNILAKLGAATRGEAVALARERGLL